jgi:hypothetical protein
MLFLDDVYIDGEAGSAPRFWHTRPLAQSVEQLAFNQLVEGSNPSRPTIKQSFSARLGRVLSDKTSIVRYPILIERLHPLRMTPVDALCGCAVNVSR